MTGSTKENASGQAGVGVAGGQAKATKQNRVLNCSAYHINRLRRKIAAAGLALRSTASDTQLTTLPKLLEFLGSDGINTYEAVGAGYLRIATRIKDLEDIWEIESKRENVIGPDGLFHKGVARYILRGRREMQRPVVQAPDPDPSQSELALEVPA